MAGDHLHVYVSKSCGCPRYHEYTNRNRNRGAVGDPPVCSPAPKLSCPGGGAMGDPSVCLLPSFLGVINDNTL
jgi:hypothetical protein